MSQSRIYSSLMNSKEWRELRARKLQANPYCELHEQRGMKVPATCIHHIREVESGMTDQESMELCYDWDNLQALCTKCHHRLHNEKGYHKKEAVLRRREERFKKWEERLKNGYCTTEK